MFSFFGTKSASGSDRFEKYIISVMSKTGQSHRRVEKRMSAAKESTGISYRDYDRYDFYKIPKKCQADEYSKIIEKKEHLKKQKESRIISVTQKK